MTAEIDRIFAQSGRGTIMGAMEEAATYTAVGGAGAAVNVAFIRGVQKKEYDGQGVKETKVGCVYVRESDVANPGIGDAVTVNGDDFKVTAKKGNSGGIWELEVMEVEEEQIWGGMKGFN